MNNFLSNKNTPFWILALCIMLGLTLPILIQDGMFMDAMLYASVAHNQSIGYGNFWFPQFSVYSFGGLSSFHEQPPLGFGIQALFFKVLGDSMYVERFYTLITMFITAFLIVTLWKEIYKNNENIKKLGWLPVILWIIIPVSFWSYQNNMLENTMGIFTLSAVYFVYKSFNTDKNNIVLYILSGVFVFLATFTKGIPGFFPIVVPFLYWIITRKINFGKALKSTIIVTLIPFVIYGILLLFPDSRESLSMYFFKRALYRIEQLPTVNNRFYILYRILTETAVPALVVIFVLVMAKFRKKEIGISKSYKEIIFFVAVGLSASAPLMITLVQKVFYFVPSLPFFGVGLAMIIAPVIANVVEKNKEKLKFNKISSVVLAGLFVAIIVFSGLQKGKYSREETMLHDVYTIGEVIPKETTLSSSVDVWRLWSLQCYLMRYFSIKMTHTEAEDYMIIDRTQKNNIPLDYKKVDINTLRFDLYKRE